MKKNHNKTGKETKDELSAVYSNLEVVGEEGKFIKLKSPKETLSSKTRVQKSLYPYLKTMKLRKNQKCTKENLF
jgi:hypothetical protein